MRHIPAPVRKSNPITNPSKAPWGATLSHADYLKLLKGFSPRDMDDRWTCDADEPDARGNTVVRLCRSWTRDEQYVLTVVAGKPEEKGSREDWATVTEIAWRNDRGETETEAEAKDVAWNLTKGLTGCTLVIKS